MAPRPKRGAKKVEGETGEKDKQEEVVAEAPEENTSRRGRRQQASEATKAWASLIPRSRSQSQAREDEEVKAKSKVGKGESAPSSRDGSAIKQGKRGGKKNEKTPTSATPQVEEPKARETQTKSKGGRGKATNQDDKASGRKSKTPTSSTTKSRDRKTRSDKLEPGTPATNPECPVNESGNCEVGDGSESKTGDKKLGKRGRTATNPRTDKNTIVNEKSNNSNDEKVNKSKSKKVVQNAGKAQKEKLSTEKPSSQGSVNNTTRAEVDEGETSLDKGVKKSTSVVTKIMEETEAKKSGRKSSSRARSAPLKEAAVESGSKKGSKTSAQNPKKSVGSLPKIDTYFEKSPVQKVIGKTGLNKNQRKRKSEDDDEEDQTPAKKATLTQLKSKKKSPPKKSLAHRDILNLLDDNNDDDKEEDVDERNSDEETEISFKTDTTANNSLNSSVPDLSVPKKPITAEAWITKLKGQVRRSTS